MTQIAEAREAESKKEHMSSAGWSKLEEGENAHAKVQMSSPSWSKAEGGEEKSGPVAMRESERGHKENMGENEVDAV
ncbi:hypothetical protein Zmor_026054 [Zophobas morio]|uniref:Uncharacterized protein n=2 Tax=Zophobas morio TaxID=2755281 RepID=A0AA38HTU9_9CUCU|nr:hypothetical protein Zmor_026054 [Zophobas morio]